MQAPFLSVWNYYPFVLSQALLSSTSCACADVSARACVHTKVDSSAEVAEQVRPKGEPGAHLMFDLATKLITMTPTELQKA